MHLVRDARVARLVRFHLGEDRLVGTSDEQALVGRHGRSDVTQGITYAAARCRSVLAGWHDLDLNEKLVFRSVAHAGDDGQKVLLDRRKVDGAGILRAAVRSAGGSSCSGTRAESSPAKQGQHPRRVPDRSPHGE